MFPAVNAGRCDLDFETALHRVFRITAEEQSLFALAEVLYCKVISKSPNFSLDQMIPPGVFEGERTPFSRTQCLFRFIVLDVKRSVCLPAKASMPDMQNAIGKRRNPGRRKFGFVVFITNE